MSKNKFDEETTWSLYKYTPNPEYPSITYFWVDENKVVKFQRSIEKLGFAPIKLDNIVGLRISAFNVKKVSNHRMTDEHLKKGWLIL